MSERNGRFPLHYQILVAMVVGAAIGLAVNPGETELPDATVRVELAGDALAVGETDAAGETVFRQTLPIPEDQSPQNALRLRFRTAAEALLEDGEFRSDVPVTERKLHIAEDPDGISLRYTRLYDGRQAVAVIEADSRAELAATAPELLPYYDRYAETLSRPVTIGAKYVGDLFLRLLKMITVPLIVTSLIVGVAGLGSGERIGSMFAKTLLYYFVTSALAITTGILMVNLIRPGRGAELPGGGEGQLAGEDQSLLGIFRGLVDSMIPPNPFAALAAADFLAIITFSILLGLFIIRAREDHRRTMTNFFNAAFEVMMDMTQFIIRLAPLGVLAYILYATASQGIEVFLTFAKYMLTVALALLLHAGVTLPLILFFVARVNPWKYFQALSPALMTAFSTASSNGTLPLTMTCVEERAGMPNRISSFVLPLGATINMDGTALYEAVAVLFIAQSYMAETGGLELSQQIVVAVTALLASVGAAGIPSAGLVMMTIVLQAVGLPTDAQGLIIAVDRVLDMARTSVNVWSDACGCAVLTRLEPEPEPAPAPEPAADVPAEEAT